MIKLAINGCCGKMGRRILELAHADSRFNVVLALEKKGHPEINSKIKELIIADDSNLIKNADVAIDFTAPESTMDILKAALKHKKALVIGTTGLNAEQIKKIKEDSAVIPIVFSPNMSVGVNVLFRLVREAVAKLKDYRVNIVETHHIHKKDAPSGTAKNLAEIIKAKTKKEVTDIKSIRKDEIVGDHEVKFESDADSIVLSHSAKTRDIFAKGAIEAAAWVKSQKFGLFNMQDVLGK